MKWIYIGVFGLAGIYLRYILQNMWDAKFASFPVGTFAINIFGAFAAGLLFSLSAQKGLLPPAVLTGIMVGFLGGFTTFSAFGLQSANLLQSAGGGVQMAPLAYLVLTPLLGLGAAFLGLSLGR